jgi:hypothetical protein
MGLLTANSAPGDLIVPQQYSNNSDNGDILQLPINPFGTPSFIWDNTNLPAHYWAGIALDQAGNLYASDYVSSEIYKLTPDRTALTPLRHRPANP